MTKTFRPSANYPIAPILALYGFEDVPNITGGYKKIRCAFHGDNNPSASVSQYGFTCFTCGRKGDAIKIVIEEEGLSYAEAVARCAAVTGVASRPVSQSGWGGSALPEF